MGLLKATLSAFLLLFSLLSQSKAQIGINYGRLSQFGTRLPPSTVVDMFKANGVTKIKIFDAEDAVLTQLKGTGIEVMVTVPNAQLDSLSRDASAARAWISANVTRWVNEGCNIRWVAAGNEPLNAPLKGQYVPILYPAMQNLYKGLQDEKQADKVKITTLINADFLTNTYPPSSSVVLTDYQPLIRNIAELLTVSQSKLFINFYPYLVVFQQKIDDLSFALFQGGSGSFVDPASNLQYTNLFDATYDGIVVALRKLGFADLEVGIGETGWASDGEPKANYANAQAFNQRVINKCLSGTGTPAHPGKVLDAYLFAWLDEDLKDLGSGTIPFERHFGLFDIQGQPKYPLNLKGGAENSSQLVGAKGVELLPKKWCVAKPAASGLEKIIAYACTNGPDCSALSSGASCYEPNTPVGHASYAMNGFYQLRQQNDEACNFDGAGQIVQQDPSYGLCRYRVGLDGVWLLNNGSLGGLQPSIWAILFAAALCVGHLMNSGRLD